MSKNYRYQKCIELYHLDGAQILFYGQLFYLLHDAFAQFLRDHHLSIKDRLINKDYFFPVVHAEADYLKPIGLDDVLEINLGVLQIGDSSFKIGYKLCVDNNLVATAHVIHACIDPQTFHKKPIPQKMREELQHYLLENLEINCNFM